VGFINPKVITIVAVLLLMVVGIENEM